MADRHTNNAYVLYLLLFFIRVPAKEHAFYLYTALLQKQLLYHWAFAVVRVSFIWIIVLPASSPCQFGFLFSQ